MHTTGYKKNTENKKGFTLFIALIVTSLLLAVGFSLGNIILKQLLLSGSGRDSQIAFYAADAGAECALYWDRKDGSGLSLVDSVFSTSTPVDQAQKITCGTGFDGVGSVGALTKDVSPDGLNATTTFYINLADPVNLSSTGGSCAKVSVIKNTIFTTIDARGYNVAATNLGTCDTAGNSRAVERGLNLNY